MIDDLTLGKIRYASRDLEQRRRALDWALKCTSFRVSNASVWSGKVPEFVIPSCCDSYPVKETIIKAIKHSIRDAEERLARAMREAIQGECATCHNSGFSGRGTDCGGQAATREPTQ